jgi:hypothetical protein
MTHTKRLNEKNRVLFELSHMMSAHGNGMCTNKSELKEDVIRANFSSAIELIPKTSTVGKTSHFPRRQTARNSCMDSVTVVIDDVALRFNAYDNKRVDENGRGSFGTGKSLVDYVLIPVLEALDQYPRIHTYVLVADAECFTTEAKEQTQAKRTETRRGYGELNGIVPLDWSEDAPRSLAPYSGPLESLESVKLTRAALRHVIFETMRSLTEMYVPPNGKRLILDFQDYNATNPTRPENWMASDAFEAVSDEAKATLDRIRAGLIERRNNDIKCYAQWLADFVECVRPWSHLVCAAGFSADALAVALDHASGTVTYENWVQRMHTIIYAADRVLARVRKEQPAKAVELHKKLAPLLKEAPRCWRSVARDLSREVCRKGLVRKIPLCIETTRTGVRLAPFRLRNCANQGGEADLTIQAFAVWLFQGAMRHALAGTRVSGQLALYEASGGETAYGKEFMDAERAKAAGEGEFKDIPIGDRGNNEQQRCLLMSVDTDFISYATANFGRQVADYCARRNCPLSVAHTEMLAHAPLLVLGEAHVSEIGIGVAPTYGTSTTAKEKGYQRAYEILDIGIVFAELTQIAQDGYEPNDEPIAQLKRVASERAEISKRRRAVTVANKKRKAMDASAPDEEQQPDETSDWALIELPHLPPDVTPLRVYERVLDFVVFCNMCGNDFLQGLPYISRRASYAGFAEMLFREPDLKLVHCHPRGSWPSESVISICPTAYVSLLKYIYFAQMSKELSKKLPAAANVVDLTYEQMAAVMRTFANAVRHMPGEEKLHLMYERLLFSLYYIAYGPFRVDQTLDPLVIGWSLGTPAIEV